MRLAAVANGSKPEYRKETLMAMRKLRTIPVDVDAEAIAEGMLEMFTDNEIAGVQFGMFPAEKMKVLEKSLTARFYAISISDGTDGPDGRIAVLRGDGPDRVREFKMSDLVAEAMRAITLAMMSQVEMVA